MGAFHWKMCPDVNVVSEPKVATVKLGDGYEQHRAVRLSNQSLIYSVTIYVHKREHPSLKAFLERYGGVRAFRQTLPYDWKLAGVVCHKRSASVEAPRITIAVDFEQVVTQEALIQDILQKTHRETTHLTQSTQAMLWEIDLTKVGGECHFFCSEQNEKGEPVAWQGRQYQAYPIQGVGFGLNGKDSATRPILTVPNLHGMAIGMVEDLRSLIGGTVIQCKICARFPDVVNFVNGNSNADPGQEVIDRQRTEQRNELSTINTSFVLSTPTEADGAVFPGRIMLVNTCTWTYRGGRCGYNDPVVTDEYDQPTSDITKDKCNKCLSGRRFRSSVGNSGGLLSINKLSQQIPWQRQDQRFWRTPGDVR